jgi:hypothetical protein
MARVVLGPGGGPGNGAAGCGDYYGITSIETISIKLSTSLIFSPDKRRTHDLNR